MGWNLNDPTTSLLPYISWEYTDSATKVEDPSLGCMNGSNVYDRCGHDTRPLHSSCTACNRTAYLPGLALNASMAGYPTQNNVFLWQNLKRHFRITIPIRGCSSFIWCKAWRHESESVKTMYLDAIESLICSMALMIAQTSAVYTDAKSGNLMEIRVSDGKTNTSHSISIPWSICIKRNVITVPVSYFTKSCWYIDAYVRSFFRCTKSSTIFGGEGGCKYCNWQFVWIWRLPL